LVLKEQKKKKKEVTKTKCKVLYLNKRIFGEHEFFGEHE